MNMHAEWKQHLSVEAGHDLEAVRETMIWRVDVSIVDENEENFQGEVVSSDLTKHKHQTNNNRVGTYDSKAGSGFT